MEQNGIVYDLLGNDNGFLPYADNTASIFQQRTLVARWMLNASAIPGATNDRAQLVRKPVLNVMGLLPRLGNLIFDRNASRALPSSRSTMNVLSTIRGFGYDDGMEAASSEIAALVYNSADSSQPDPNATRTATLNFNLSSAAVAAMGTDAAVALFRLDNEHGNAYATWQGQGFPKFPSAKMFAELRDAAEVVVDASFPAQVNWDTPLSFEVRASLFAPMHLANLATAHWLFCSTWFCRSHSQASFLSMLAASRRKHPQVFRTFACISHRGRPLTQHRKTS